MDQAGPLQQRRQAEGRGRDMAELMAASGDICKQRHPVFDTLMTTFDAVLVLEPRHGNCAPQRPMEGVSMLYN